MQLRQNGLRGLAVLVDLGADRVLIPLAVILGLVCGVLAGVELSPLHAPFFYPAN